MEIAPLKKKVALNIEDSNTSSYKIIGYHWNTIKVKRFIET
jgi:hypothetical protein